MPAVADQSSSPTALDLFAGCGGATTGLTQAGIRVLAAIENDPTAAASLRLNHPDTRVLEDDIRKVDPDDLVRTLGLERGQLTVLKACPPCQGYSSRGRSDAEDERNDLVSEVWRFVRAFRPQAVLVENVPGLGRDERLVRLERQLRGSGYRLTRSVLDASVCGVPQRRRRLIVVAVLAPFRIPQDPTAWLSLTDPVPASTVFVSQERSIDDGLNRFRQSGAIVRERIEAVPVRGGRLDLPEHLQLECHKRLDSQGRVATESYGRIDIDQPAPTMTTKCTTPSSGRFIHPTEHRGITLREAATIQGFPSSYRLSGGYDQMERQIGNAIPVGMARTLAEGLLRHMVIADD